MVSERGTATATDHGKPNPEHFARHRRDNDTGAGHGQRIGHDIEYDRATTPSGS